ncbi:MAG: hypothetical protein WCD11_25135 [Solirubrobacteraceae bacterium]
MNWLALTNWVFVAALALGAARAPLVSLAGQAILVLSGLGAIIVLVSGGASAWAFIAVGLACAAGVFATVAARTLMEDPPDTARRVGQSRMETSAALEGLLLPFLATAGLLSLLAAFY